MLKKALAVGLLAVVAGASAPLWSQDKPATTQPAGGEIPESRIDDACRRILRLKARRNGRAAA